MSANPPRTLRSVVNSRLLQGDLPPPVESVDTSYRNLACILQHHKGLPTTVVIHMVDGKGDVVRTVALSTPISLDDVVFVLRQHDTTIYFVHRVIVAFVNKVLGFAVEKASRDWLIEVLEEANDVPREVLAHLLEFLPTPFICDVQAGCHSENAMRHIHKRGSSRCVASLKDGIDRSGKNVRGMRAQVSFEGGTSFLINGGLRQLSREELVTQHGRLGLIPRYTSVSDTVAYLYREIRTKSKTSGFGRFVMQCVDLDGVMYTFFVKILRRVSDLLEFYKDSGNSCKSPDADMNKQILAWLDDPSNLSRAEVELILAFTSQLPIVFEVPGHRNPQDVPSDTEDDDTDADDDSVCGREPLWDILRRFPSSHTSIVAAGERGEYSWVAGTPFRAAPMYPDNTPPLLAQDPDPWSPF